MQLRSRSTIALLPALLCLACGADTSGTSNSGTSNGGAGNSGTSDSRPDVTIAPTLTLEPTFAPARGELRSLAASFLGAALEYDARTAGRLDFLADVEPLVTAAELHRLKHSARASLPWQVLRARGESTELAVNGITRTTSPAQTLHLQIWVTLTTHTDFATLQELASVTLTLAPTGSGWQVDQAHGAGL